MKLRSVRAVYKDGELIFPDPCRTPEDGEEVVVTFVERVEEQQPLERDPIEALRGRGRGENLVEKLLESRRKDQQRDDREADRLRP